MQKFLAFKYDATIDFNLETRIGDNDEQITWIKLVYVQAMWS